MIKYDFKSTIEKKGEKEKTTSTVYRPELEQKIDGVVASCHGFPGSNRPELKLGPILTKKGIALVEVGYRGDKNYKDRKGSQGTFSFVGSITDIATTLMDLRHNLPTTPLCVLGYSAGALYALNLVRKHPELLDSLVLLNPVVDPRIFTNEKLMDELWFKAENVTRTNNAAFYEAEIQTLQKDFNPLDFAEDITVPITILQATDDEIINRNTVSSFFLRIGSRQLNYIPIINTGHDIRGDEPELIAALTR